MILYIAGPMTHYPDKNRGEFAMAERALTKIGHAVLNPTRHELAGRTWQQYMDLGLRDVLNADGIAVITNWGLSRGARLEVDVALALDKPVKPLFTWIEQAGWP